MSHLLNYVVFATPGISSATVLGYLLDSCSRFNLKTVYVEVGASIEKVSRQSTNGVKSMRWFNSWENLRLHLGLACVLPRHYFFKFMESAHGITELRFLLWCNRFPSAVFNYLCGFPLPSELQGKKFLKTWDEVIKQYSLCVKHVDNFNSEISMAEIRRDDPDVAIGLGTRILSSELLRIPRLGVLNGHSSLLPEYRGGTTEFWQLAAKCKYTGVTIHWMLPKVDEGPIIAQRKYPIPPGIDHYHLRLMSLFYRLELWRETIEGLGEGRCLKKEQYASGTKTYKHPSLRNQFDFYFRGI